MLLLPYAEIYLTNVCNLACDNCNRFNNFAFKGHERWVDRAQSFEKWSNIVDIETITIIGGEPFTNPDIAIYIKEIRRLWPSSMINVATNGTHLHKIKGMINDLRNNNIQIKISLHSHQLAQKIESELDNIMEHPVSINYKFEDFHIDAWQKSYNQIKGSDWPDCNSPYDFKHLPDHIRYECHHEHGFSYENFISGVATKKIIDAKGLKIEITWYDNFHESAVLLDSKNNIATLHNSDPEKSVDVCDQKFCHTFKNGKLYKCGTAAVLPDFINQFNIKIKAEEKNIINSYEAASPDWDHIKLKDFIDELGRGEHISMCRFCPETFDAKQLMNVLEKPKLVKR